MTITHDYDSIDVALQREIGDFLTKLSGKRPDVTSIPYEDDIGTSYLYETSFKKGGKKVDITIEFFTLHPPDISILVVIDDDKKIGRRVDPDRLKHMFKKIRKMI